MRKVFIFTTFILLLASCRSQQNATAEPKRPKNIILMIGDGMGITQITAGYIMNGMKLNLTTFPVVGLHKNFPAPKDGIITDSAAGATAFACGVKTYNAAIGVDADTIPVPTILELANKKGMATGLVATSTIVHATPASFISHNKHRNNYEEIALDFMNTDINLFIGGGMKYFNQRTDKQDLVAKLRSRNYDVRNWIEEDLQKVVPNTQKNLAYFTADNDPLPVAQGRDYLPFASKFACDFLKKSDTKDKGFFMMIEGSQIDWGGHANQQDYLVSEMIDFDKAIGEVLEFAKKDGNTLVIVTADHECGAYSILKGSTKDVLVPSFGSDYHTPDMIPVFSFGPGSELFGGVYENNEIFLKMKNLLKM